MGRDEIDVPTLRKLLVSIHAPRVGRDAPPHPPRPAARVSIHAPRVGRDFTHDLSPFCPRSFNSRAPRGARLLARRRWWRRSCFNSRAPRGARQSRTLAHAGIKGFQFTRPAWGATFTIVTSPPSGGVSIHAPRVGRDIGRRGRRSMYRVSIHAPRVGRDPGSGCLLWRVRSFNSRAPRGARRPRMDLCPRRDSFNSRAPRGARHKQPFVHADRLGVSIHAPRVGRDWEFGERHHRADSFNSRAPRGARHPAT